jgi:uncharacterized membrane-anchored protein
MKRLIALLLAFCGIAQTFAQADSNQFIIDSLEASLQYQHGEIKFNGIGTLAVPTGFRFLDAKQAQFVLEDWWGNPQDSTVMGMIVPQNRGMMASNSWAFIITYEKLGYVDDDDAEDIDYEDLLEEMKTDSKSENEMREKGGYDRIELVGWADKPFYDADKKVLHWAKEYKFGSNEFNTLNYNVRILGRKGVLVLNAVSPIAQLTEVKANISPVLTSFTYAEGTKYEDFNPKLDEVAAWTIGGLVAGKILAKVGIFALLLKYIKVVIIGIGALGTAIWKWFKRKTQPPTVRNIEES